MSNIGQAVLTVVGTVVGAYFGNPELGFALGSLAGSVLFPTQLPRGPQLTDNRTTTASLGEPVPIIFGTASVAGTVIWLAPSVQSTYEQGGKGGPEQQEYQYNQSIAIGLCESPVDLEQAIGGLTRVWENGTLVYDIRPQQAANTDTGQVAETDEEYAQRLAGSATYAETFVLYLGTEDQEPDPTIQAIEGVGNTQPFLGLAYIVYPNRLLQIAQGWRHPNFQFEVFQSGTGDCTTTNQTTVPVLYPWLDGDPYGNPLNPANINSFYGFQIDVNAPEYSAAIAAGIGNLEGGVQFSTLDAALSQMSTWQGFGCDTLTGFAVHSYDDGILSKVIRTTGVTTAPLPNQLVDWPQTAYVDLYYGDQAVSSQFDHQVSAAPLLSPGIRALDVMSFYGTGSTLTSGTPVADSAPAPATHFYRVTNQEFYGALYWNSARNDIGITVKRAPGSPPDPCLGLPIAPDPEYCVLPDGQWQSSSGWTLVTDYATLENYRCLQNFGGQGPSRLYPPLGPVLTPTDPNYDNEAYWTAAYDAALAAGTAVPGRAWGTGFPVQPAALYVNSTTVCEGSGAQAKVADIIRAVCGRASVTDIDVTDMENYSVAGYPISSLSSAVDILNPLRSVAFYDAVESGPTIRFQSRGKAIVASLGTDDIGAYDGGKSGNSVPPSLSVLRALDSDLPRRIRYHYISTERDYQAGEQDSPFRPTSIAVNDQDISIPIAMSDTQALQSAEIIWADAWNGRTQYTLSIGTEWAALEPGDAIAIPVEGFTERVRITADQNSGGVLRKLTCVSDDSRSYTSIAIAPPPGYTPTKITLICPTNLYLLDLPALQDADASAGFYTAVSRIWGSGNAYKGATVYKSVDGGSTFATQYAQTNEATSGTLNAAVSASACFTWDTETVITVNLPDDSLSFQSLTDDAVLAGGNAAAMGADGRWEIIQFATATKVAPKKWHLSRLLRGRRGTEHVVGTSLEADEFIMLVAGQLARITLNASEIGNTDDYEGVSIGASFSTGVPIEFTGRGVALKPFSPVDIKAAYQTDGDILIAWTRRDKLGRTLMSGVDIPNSEAMLAFQVDILDISPDSPEVVVRTIAVTDTQALYTAAQIAADFGGSGPAVPYTFESAQFTEYNHSTVDVTIGAGQQVIVLANDMFAGGETLSLSDGTNTYVLRGSQTDSYNSCTFALFDCLDPVPGSYTITLSGADGGGPNMLVLIYEGIASFDAGSFASAVFNSPTTATDAIATTAITPSSYPAMVLGVAAAQPGTSMSAGTDFNGRYIYSGDVYPVWGEDVRLTSGSHIASFTMASGGNSPGILGAAYLEAGGGGGGGPSSLRVAVYQMSSVVGRGTPGKAIIDLGDVP